MDSEKETRAYIHPPTETVLPKTYGSSDFVTHTPINIVGNFGPLWHFSCSHLTATDELNILRKVLKNWTKYALRMNKKSAKAQTKISPKIGLKAV